MGEVYEKVKEFKKKYPGTVTWWRLKKHSEVVEKHMNPGEKILYAFAGQKNACFYDLWSTSVVVLSNKRILIGRKRMLWGYMFTTITPDMFNDLEVYQGIIWGTITIDTVKEEVVLTNLSKRSLPEIETAITEFMMEEKKKYGSHEEHCKKNKKSYDEYVKEMPYKKYDDVE
ncbi:MAG: hypothetical protein E7158_02275 [Firmicutes bacterium]|nr:hypothetical protein [Bacillota bacterium]